MNETYPERKYNNGDRVATITQKYQMIVIGATACLAGWRYELRFPKKDGTPDKSRYSLWRIWDKGKPTAMVIGLNPPTANANKNDATINLLRTVLNKLGYGGFYMMNCYTYIASKPKLLKTNPASEEWNNNLLSVTASKCKDVIFAWGTFDIIKERGRDKELIEMFPGGKCFGINQDGSPFHPRAMTYIKGGLKNANLMPYIQKDEFARA